jgi:group I intron endonuclease
MYIYLITNKINNKKYIGKCEKLPNKTNYYFGSGIAIKSAIKKYGKENFTKEILEENLTKENICEREIYWIKELNTHSEIGYNLTDGGDGILNLSEKMRKKLSDLGKQRIGNLNNRYGSKLTDEHKEILRKINLGRKLSQETKEKISNKKKGFKVSDQTKKKMSENRIGKKLSEDIKINMSKNKPNKIKVVKIDKKTKNILSVYESLKMASLDSGVKIPNISMCINKKLKSSGGFIWVKVID